MNYLGDKVRHMTKRWLFMMLLGLWLWPQAGLAQAPDIAVRQVKMSDLEMSMTRGQGLDKPKSRQDTVQGRIILWDEFNRAKQNVSGVGNQVIVSGPRP
jgi:hypothetical protein